MAEHVKRRVAAARLAVAFAAAGVIAGATAWAQADSPGPTAQSSAFDAFLKIDSSDVVDGSLLFKDFKKFEVPSYKQFHKNEVESRHFKKAVFNRYYSKAETDKLFIKGESTEYVKRAEISSYLKRDEADARYVKLTDSVVRGDGSVFTASQLVDLQEQNFTPMLAVPGMLQVDVMGQAIRITNTSGGDLGHTEWGVNNDPPAGTLKSGDSIECFLDSGAMENIQFFSWGARGVSATLSASSVTDGQRQMTQNTVQILVGL